MNTVPLSPMLTSVLCFVLITSTLSPTLNFAILSSFPILFFEFFYDFAAVCVFGEFDKLFYAHFAVKVYAVVCRKLLSAHLTRACQFVMPIV